MFNVRKIFLLFLFLFLLPTVGVSTSHFLEKRHDNSFYTSVEKQLNKTRTQLKLMNVVPQEVCTTQNNDIKLRYFCAHYGRFDTLRTFSLWSLCLGGGVFLFVLFAGLLFSHKQIAFLITIWVAFIGLAISFALQTVVLNFIIALFMINILNRGFAYGVAEGFGLLGLLVSFGMMGVVISALNNKEKQPNGNIFQNVRSLIDTLSLSFNDSAQDHFIHQVALFPGRIMLEYCLAMFKESQASKHQNKAKG